MATQMKLFPDRVVIIWYQTFEICIRHWQFQAN